VAPISYSPGQEPLHRALASYKRLPDELARRSALELAAILWRHLAEHERCVARAAGVSRFSVVTTVPSGVPSRDQHQPLRRIVADLVGPTRARYERLLRRSALPLGSRAFSRQRFEALGELHGETVLLIDDTWTTGASAQSAAAALKHAGASVVGAVVIGRYVNRQWRDNDRRLNTIVRPYDWHRCALCAVRAGPLARYEPRVAA
jgi:phosphoribosylpyrophosphate synthetase